MNKLIFAARTREALKSYAQMNNLNPNNYVLVEIPGRIRENAVVKSLVQNISNPAVKYIMVHKSCVTVTHNGKPALNITALKENSHASALNKPQSEKIGEKTVKADGSLKSLVVDIYKSDLSPKEKFAALNKVKSFVNQKKEEEQLQVLKAIVEDIENSNLGDNEKYVALKSLQAALYPEQPKVTARTALKSILSDINQSNLPLQIKNVLFSVIKSMDSEGSRVQKIDRKDEFVKVAQQRSMTGESSDSMNTASMTNKKAKMKNADEEAKDDVTKSLGSLGSKVFEKRDLVEENRQLLKSLGSLSDEDAVFNNLHMARRYARLFNEKIASPSQRAEVKSPSVKDVQRFGKRVKAKVEIV